MSTFSISDAGCSPSAITVPSGPVGFAVTNAGTDTGEFEITVANQRVVDEVENIVPGFVVNMTTRLDGGTTSSCAAAPRHPSAS